MNRFRKNTGIILIARIAIIVVFVVGFAIVSYFGLGKSASLNAAEDIQEAYTGLSSYSTGNLSLDSIYDAFDYSGISLDEFEMTTEEKGQFEAMIRVGSTIRSSIPNVSDSESDGVSAAYLGIENGEIVDGVYVIKFEKPLEIEQALIDKAHELEEEYYFIQGNYLVVMNADFAEMNNIDITNFGQKLSEELK